jgi:hypothetical protein
MNRLIIISMAWLVALATFSCRKLEDEASPGGGDETHSSQNGSSGVVGSSSDNKPNEKVAVYEGEASSADGVTDREAEDLGLPPDTGSTEDDDTDGDQDGGTDPSGDDGDSDSSGNDDDDDDDDDQLPGDGGGQGNGGGDTFPGDSDPDDNGTPDPADEDPILDEEVIVVGTKKFAKKLIDVVILVRDEPVELKIFKYGNYLVVRMTNPESHRIVFAASRLNWNDFDSEKLRIVMVEDELQIFLNEEKIINKNMAPVCSQAFRVAPPFLTDILTTLCAR